MLQVSTGAEHALELSNRCVGFRAVCELATPIAPCRAALLIIAIAVRNTYSYLCAKHSVVVH